MPAGEAPGLTWRFGFREIGAGRAAPLEPGQRNKRLWRTRGLCARRLTKREILDGIGLTYRCRRFADLLSLGPVRISILISVKI